MRKGIFTTLVVLLAFCVGFVVYGGGTQEAKVQEVTIQMWAGPESRAMSAVVDKWNQDYADMTGIKVSAPYRHRPYGL